MGSVREAQTECFVRVKQQGKTDDVILTRELWGVKVLRETSKPRNPSRHAAIRASP